MASAKAPFPKAPADFEQDVRVSFDNVRKKWILEEDAAEWEFDESLRRWIPSLDEELMRRHASAYAVAGVDENEPAQPSKNKRKQDEEAGRSNGKKKAKSGTPKQNKAVYVTNLPMDVTVEEISEIFGRCGMIAESIDDEDKPRIKMYQNDDGKFKGDALVVYFRPESVPLAIQMLDDSDFRLGQRSANGKMRVQEAESSYKRHDNDEAPSNNPQQPGKRGGLTKEQRKIIKRTEQMNRLADWSSDEEPSALPETSSRYDKIVILKHMFTLEELEGDPAALLEIKEDIRTECEKFGSVTSLVLFDREKDGVVTVRFADAEAARACVRVLDGRVFAGQAVKAYISDGSEKFKKSKKKDGDNDDNDNGDTEERRLDEFGKWLEEEETVDASNN